MFCAKKEFYYLQFFGFYGHFFFHFFISDISKRSLIFGLLWTPFPYPIPLSLVSQIDSNHQSYNKTASWPLKFNFNIKSWNPNPFQNYMWNYVKCKVLILNNVLYYISLKHSIHYKYWGINLNKRIRSENYRKIA